MFSRLNTFYLLLFSLSCLTTNSAFADKATNKHILTEKVAVSFTEICAAKFGVINEAVVKGVYSFSMEAASGLYIEIEEDDGSISSHWVGKSGNNFHDDKLASEQTESLLTLAYLNQMKVDICLLEHTLPTVVFGVRLR